MLYALAFLSLMHTLVCYHAVLSSSISIPRVYSAFQVNEALSEALSSNASTAIGLLVDSGASPGLQKALQDTLSRSTSATQVALVRAESLADVQQAFQLVDLADFSVLYLPRTQRLHENRVLQLAERLLAGSAKVAVLLDGDDVHCRQLESRVRALVLPQRPQQPADQLLFLRLPSSQDWEATTSSSLLSHLQSVLPSNRSAYAVPKQGRQERKHSALPDRGPSLEQLQAMRAAPLLFGDGLRRELRALQPCGATAPPSWNSTRPQVLAALQASLLAWQDEHSDALQGEAAGVQAVCAALHGAALRNIAEYVKGNAAQHRDYLLRAFEKTLRKLSGQSQSRANLQQLAQSLTKRHRDLLRSMEGDLCAMLRSTLPRGEHLKLSVNSQHMVASLAADLFSAVEQQLKRLVLSGALNPFLRTHTFPPVRIGLHYLFYPQRPAVSGDLFDEHKHGACVNRADALRFEGVARYPFDFNEAPAPTEAQESWVDLVKAFFTV